MAQAGCRRPPAAETRFWSQGIPYGMCDGQTDNGTGLYPVCIMSLVHILSSTNDAT